MQHVRNSNHRKMLKPKYFSSSSDDDVDDASPFKWKPNAAPFPIEANAITKRNQFIDSLSSKISKKQKLSAEVIQKEEIYNQAEIEANKKIFGCANPGRCLSKDEIKRRKDIILHIVNERLKSKLSELMGEFGERIEMNDADTGRCRSTDDEDDDSIPEAPPPPTFNTSSESSDDELDLSMTKEFESYEKEIKGKTSVVKSSTSTTQTASTLTAALRVSASHDSVQFCPSVPVSQTHTLQSTTTSNQNYWQRQQPPTQQWSSNDSAPWIPPVGPPQVMEPFPPPIEAEKTFLMKPLPNISIFTHVNPANGWIKPACHWTNTPPSTLTSIPQYPNPQWNNILQPSHSQQQNVPQMHSLAVGSMKCDTTGHKPSGFYSRPTVPYDKVAAVRPNTSVLPVQNKVVSESTYVNAILAAGKKVETSTSETGMKSNHVKCHSVNERRSGLNPKSQFEGDSNIKKRSYDQEIGSSNFTPNSVHKQNLNKVNKRVRLDDTTEKKTRFGSPHEQIQRRNHTDPISKNHSASLEHRSKCHLNAKYETFSQLEARQKKTNEATFKILSKFWSTNNRTMNKTELSKKNPSNCQTNTPIEWKRLCDVVDKLVDLPPKNVKDIPSADRQMKERSELLMILSDNPENLFSHVDKYGERNVRLSVKMAQRILFPQGRYDDAIAFKIAPFQKAIHIALNAPEFKQETVAKRNANIKSESIPKEWVELCSIVDKLLDIPAAESLSLSDSRLKERNDILMMLSNEPEDFLLHDEKYGAHNVDWAIFEAKRILRPDNVLDERVRKIMVRQREKLIKHFYKSNNERSNSRDTESSKRSKNERNDDYRSRSLPKEWNQLCDIVDSALDTPKEVRVKMSKRDPRWEQRENILLVLSDDPDKLASQSAEYGTVNVDWVIKSSKKILYPNGSKDRSIFKKLSPQRRMLLRSRQCNSLKEDNTLQKTDDSTKEIIESKGKQIHRKNDDKKANEISAKENKSLPETGKKTIVTETNKTKQRSESNEEADVVTDKEIDVNEVWIKLCNIVDKLLDLPTNAADKLESTDRRLIERNDILMVLSDNPDNFSKFDANYGTTNVTWAINSTKKLIFPNGKPTEKLTDALWKQRDAIMCWEESLKDASSNECNEWTHMRKIAAKVFRLADKGISKEKKLSKEQLHQQIELLLQLSDNPDIVRSTSICKKIGEGRIEVAIAKCKHILNGMRKQNSKRLLEFESLRSKMVLYSESLNQSKNIKNYNVILTEVRKIVDEQMFNEIFGQSFNKWTQTQKLERNELAILLIKDPFYLKSNVKYLEMVRKAGKATEAQITAEVEKCLLKCEYVKEKPTESTNCAPIIAKIKDVKYMNQFKERKLTHRIHRLIEQFLIAPKPEIFEVGFDSSDGTVDVVCANKMTFDWLKSSVRELDGLWPNAKLTIIKAPITRNVLDIDDLKEIKMAFKTVPTQPFAVIMKQLKKKNPKLNSEKWQAIPSSFSESKKMLVLVDLDSLIELERSKREIYVESGTIYFDIKYIGKENFETEC